MCMIIAVLECKGSHFFWVLRMMVVLNNALYIDLLNEPLHCCIQGKLLLLRGERVLLHVEKINL